MPDNSEPQTYENPGSDSTSAIPNPFTELVNSFRALKGAPRGFWYTNDIYWLDDVADL